MPNFAAHQGWYPLALNQNLHVEDLPLPHLEHKQELDGSLESGPSMNAAAFLAQQTLDSAYMLRVADAQAAQTLRQSVHSLNPMAACFELEAFDNTPGLYPSPQLIAQRVGFLHRLLHAQKGDIFIVSQHTQKTLPVEVLQSNSQPFQIGGPCPLPERLEQLGYTSSSLVEDVGSYARRGGVLDIFSPAHLQPIRLELCGNSIESLRSFDIETQKSLAEVEAFNLVPARETLYLERSKNEVFNAARAHLKTPTHSSSEAALPHDTSLDELKLSKLRLGEYFRGQEFLLPCFYATPASLNDYIKATCNLVVDLNWAGDHHKPNHGAREHQELPIFLKKIKKLRGEWSQFQACVHQQILKWKQAGKNIFLFTNTQHGASKLKSFLTERGWQLHIACDNEYLWSTWAHEQHNNPNLLHIVPRPLPEPLQLENLVLLNDVLGDRSIEAEPSHRTALNNRIKKAQALSFSQLNTGELVVHRTHGIGVYEGLKTMPLQGGLCEFMQIQYRGGDKLYVPVYKLKEVQKHSASISKALIDKLGGSSFYKTKVKTAHKLRDIAADLLKMYAQRRLITRKPLVRNEASDIKAEYEKFKHEFVFTETPDQEKSIRDVLGDLSKPEPMDRLICGDVGFGKTEVAMRAVFYALQNSQQIALIAPTTVLCMQHYERFEQRFKNWSARMAVLNRFVSPQQTKNILNQLKQGQVDIVIGTHRLLSRDVQFKSLGLLVIDEEQKFGVRHKEKLRQLKLGVDTLAMSATPIPRSLNLSLMGLRDLSLIHTAPKNRWPVKTFVSHYEPDLVRRCILNEKQRGGQVFFVHNRVQGLAELAHDLKQLVPEVSLQWAHGQMPADGLEKTMLQFFKGQIDVLVCTKIIESGMDISNANTIMVHNAQQFGLSELYQLRGRVGRSNRRAYCYLLTPKNRPLEARARERLQILQNNTALGSGITVAQYDLELRGAGHILGEAQSGHVNALGHELYQDLLEQAIHEQRGQPVPKQIEPDIQLPMAALIPDKYIPDLRVRLSYYKTLSQLETEAEFDDMEDELKDRFGALPDEVVNLLGLMSVRRVCCELGVSQLRVSQLKAKPISLRLAFVELKSEQAMALLQLVQRKPSVYKAQPNNTLSVRLESSNWPSVYSRLQALKSQLN